MQRRISFTWTWAASVAGSQQIFELRVQTVDILEEPYLAIRKYHCGGVHDQNRNWLIEHNGDGLCSVHRIGDSFRRPLRLVPKNPFRELLRVFDAYAAVTEVPAGSRKQ